MENAAKRSEAQSPADFDSSKLTPSPHVALERYLFFFYGSLMDLDVLRTITGVLEEPVLMDAWVEGYQMKMWQGIYPTLLPLWATNNDSGQRGHTSNIDGLEIGTRPMSSNSKIHGKAWYATTVDQCLALQSYETGAYEPSDCRIHFTTMTPGNEKVENIVNGLTFTWAGSLTDEELEQGVFSLEHWMKEIKPKVWH